MQVVFLSMALLFFGLFARTGDSQGQQANLAPLPVLPLDIPDVGNARNGISLLIPGQGQRALTLIPELQEGLTRFIRTEGNPIASVVVVDNKTGEILAMAQGRPPQEWGSTSHTALYEGFPAASLFKTVTTAAAIERANFEPEDVVGINCSCSDVPLHGAWLTGGQLRKGKNNEMTLSRAFARSCNGAYATLALKYIGLGNLDNFAEKLGFGKVITTDFHLNPSPINPPKPSNSSIHTVGKYAAGFGDVELSAMHAAWIYLLIARDGRPLPLRIFKSDLAGGDLGARIISQETAQKIRQMMHETVSSGTARGAFRSNIYQKIRPFVGGKTGTLNGKNPKGLTTWFAGSYWSPHNEGITVSAVVVNGEVWKIKGSGLAAQAMLQWENFCEQRQTPSRQPPNTVSKKDKASVHVKG